MWITLIIVLGIWSLFWRSPLFRNSAFRPGVLVLLFLLKFAGGALLSTYYTEYSGLPREKVDILKYYDDGAIMASSFQNSPRLFLDLFFDKDGEGTEEYYAEMNNWARAYDLIQVNDNRIMIRVHALLHLCSGGRYWVHLLFFALMAFIGIFLTCRAVVGWTGGDERWMLLLATLSPSLIAWTSVPLKEAWVMLPVGLCTAGLLSLRKGKGLSSLLLGVLLLAGIKPYIGIAMAAMGFVLLLVTLTPMRAWAAFGLSFLLALGGLALGGLFPKLDVIGVLALKQRDFYNVAELRSAGSVIDIPSFQNWAEFVLGIPMAIWNTLTRPYLWEAHTTMALLSSIEQMVILLFALFAVLIRRSPIRWDVLLTLLTMVIWTFIFVGMTTPVLGAAVRYRTPALLFLLLGLLCILDVKRVEAWFKK